MERSVEDIRLDIKTIEEEIAVKSKNPKVAEYLRMRKIVDQLNSRMDRLAQRNEKEAIEEYNACSLELTNRINELDDYVEQEADNLEVRNCIRLVHLKDSFTNKLPDVRENQYNKKVHGCIHIFGTWLSKNGHTETTCIKCGISSNPSFLLRISERLKNMLTPIIINLFFHGKAYEYTFITSEFNSLQEAKEAWLLLSKEEISRKLEPEETVKELIRIRDSRMRRY